MDTLFVGVFFPHPIVRFHIDPLQPIPGDNIKFTDGVIELRRIACGNHNPALGNPVTTENLVLQKLQHGRRQGFGHAVDLIQKQNAFLQAGFLHHIVNRGNDFRHCVLRHAVFPAAVSLVGNKRQTQCGLTGMMGHGVADQTHSQFTGHLFHNGGLTDTGRAHKENRPLPFNGDSIITVSILGKICLHGIVNLFFGLLNIHTSSSFSGM